MNNPTPTPAPGSAKNSGTLAPGSAAGAGDSLLPASSGSSAALHPADAADASAVLLISDIAAGRRATSQLSAEQRQQCVDHLQEIGRSTSETARLLGISERTVRRDRDAARKARALNPSLSLGGELLGDLHTLTAQVVQRLTLLARDAATPPYVRLRANEGIIRIQTNLVDTGLRMKYISDGADLLRHLRDGTDPQLDRYIAQVRSKMAEQQVIDISIRSGIESQLLNEQLAEDEAGMADEAI